MSLEWFPRQGADLQVARVGRWRAVIWQVAPAPEGRWWAARIWRRAGRSAIRARHNTETEARAWCEERMKEMVDG